jgi:RimJ/RimL family protein N-acetyltransferase
LAAATRWGIITPMIQGERVRLRRIERNDLPRFVEWLNDPAVREHLALVYPLSLPEEEQWFEATLRLEPAGQPFAIDARTGTPGEEPAEWLLIGSIGFHSIDWRNRSADVGIVIGRRDYQGKGYGTDALRTLCRWGFEQLNLNRIHLRVFEDNPGGIACYEKLGFRHEGRLRQDRYQAGRYLDTLIMGLLRGELR